MAIASNALNTFLVNRFNCLLMICKLYPDVILKWFFQAEMPEDWDTEMDGDWEAPLIENPACAAADGCGTWSQPIIDNPDYKGNVEFKNIFWGIMIHGTLNPSYLLHLISISQISIEKYGSGHFDHFSITKNLANRRTSKESFWPIRARPENF